MTRKFFSKSISFYDFIRKFLHEIFYCQNKIILYYFFLSSFFLKISIHLEDLLIKSKNNFILSTHQSSFEYFRNKNLIPSHLFKKQKFIVISILSNNIYLYTISRIITYLRNYKKLNYIFKN